MAHRHIEVLIGRLITDERFRLEFLEHPEETLAALRERGFDLTPTEVAALSATDPLVWTEAADGIDARLQKLKLS